MQATSPISDDIKLITYFLVLSLPSFSPRCGDRHCDKMQENINNFGKIEEVKGATITMKEKLEKEQALQKMIEEDKDLEDLPDLE